MVVPKKDLISHAKHYLLYQVNDVVNVGADPFFMGQSLIFVYIHMYFEKLYTRLPNLSFRTFYRTLMKNHLPSTIYLFPYRAP